MMETERPSTRIESIITIALAFNQIKMQSVNVLFSRYSNVTDLLRIWNPRLLSDLSQKLEPDSNVGVANTPQRVRLCNFCVTFLAGKTCSPKISLDYKKGDKRQQRTQCRCLNVYFLAIYFTLRKRRLQAINKFD